MPIELENAVAIVTGSAAGIGAATAKLLAGKGCRVVVNYTKSETEAETVVRACEALGAETALCRADVSDDDDCRRLVATATDRWGRLDILVNNAGTTAVVRHGDLEGLDGADFLRVYAVNVVGAYQMVRAAVPHLRKSGNGGIVNVSSMAGVHATGSSMAYSSSKAALNALTLSLARILGPEIRVNAVAPGFVKGRWLQGVLGEDRYDRWVDRLERESPLQRVGSPEDFARVIVWLAAEADMMTGDIVGVDAGNHLGPHAGR